MIFKVFYQEDKTAAPIREYTQSMFIEAESESAVRQYMTDNKPYMIEYVEEVSEALLEYERAHNEDFKVEEI